MSPHLDDAVFGCGALVAEHPGAVVVTIFAGRPPHYDTLAPWDEASGFQLGDDVIAARREEDRAALAVLGATPRWLDFLDSQYGASPGVADIAAELENAIRDAAATSVAIPLGLFHSDHHLTHDAGIVIARRLEAIEWLVYAEAIYRVVPGLVDEKLAELTGAGLAPTPVTPRVDGDRARKERAVRCYASQLRAFSQPWLSGYADALEAERYWRLHP